MTGGTQRLLIADRKLQHNSNENSAEITSTVDEPDGSTNVLGANSNGSRNLGTNELPVAEIDEGVASHEDKNFHESNDICATDTEPPQEDLDSDRATTTHASQCV